MMSQGGEGSRVKVVMENIVMSMWYLGRKTKVFD